MADALAKVGIKTENSESGTKFHSDKDTLILHSIRPSQQLVSHHCNLISEIRTKLNQRNMPLFIGGTQNWQQIEGQIKLSPMYL